MSSLRVIDIDPELLQRSAAALDLTYDDLLEHVRFAPAVNVDETGWRLKSKQRTLWGAFTERAAVFRIAPDRHEREARALLGEEFAGIVGSDRWWAYNTLDPANRQVCWSHYADLLVMPTSRRKAGRLAVSAAIGSA